MSGPSFAWLGICCGLGLSAPSHPREPTKLPACCCWRISATTPSPGCSRAGHDEAALYALAIDVLVHLHRLAPAAALPAGLPAYDMPRLLDEALLLADWYMPAVLGRPTDAGARAATTSTAWQEVLRRVLAAPADPGAARLPCRQPDAARRPRRACAPAGFSTSRMRSPDRPPTT